MKIEFNERGFAYAEFEDRYKQKCSIQKSSLAFEDCIWLGVDVGIPVELGGTGELGRMHLTQEMAAELIPILQRFVETGELYGETNKRFDEAMSNADIKERLKVIAARMNAERDEAKELLKTYNRWRRGEDLPVPDPVEIGKAIDKLTL